MSTYRVRTISTDQHAVAAEAERPILIHDCTDAEHAIRVYRQQYHDALSVMAERADEAMRPDRCRACGGPIGPKERLARNPRTGQLQHASCPMRLPRVALGPVDATVHARGRR